MDQKDLSQYPLYIREQVDKIIKEQVNKLLKDYDDFIKLVQGLYEDCLYYQQNSFNLLLTPGIYYNNHALDDLLDKWQKKGDYLFLKEYNNDEHSSVLYVKVWVSPRKNGFIKEQMAPTLVFVSKPTK